MLFVWVKIRRGYSNKFGVFFKGKNIGFLVNSANSNSIFWKSHQQPWEADSTSPTINTRKGTNTLSFPYFEGSFPIFLYLLF